MAHKPNDPSRSRRAAGDRALGMDRTITRRDLLHGMVLGAGLTQGVSAEEGSTVAPQDVPGYYPPRWRGLRGSAPGTFEIAHAVRDGAAIGAGTADTERFDVVIVGAGISGLSAAHFYRAERPNARVLLLDNHDDFGGHARRNEFEIDGRLHLMNGGTLEIDSPRPYSPVADGLLRTLGIDAKALAATVPQPQVYERLGMSRGVFFDREHFGEDRLVAGYGSTPWRRWLALTPLSAAARRDLARVEIGRVDYLSQLTPAQKQQRLLHLSYERYLREIVRVDPTVVVFYSNITNGEWGVGIDAVSALDAWGFGLPGFDGLKLPHNVVRGMGFTPAGYSQTGGSVKLHLPDGNATIARALVRQLIPQAIGAPTVEALITAPTDYAQLDRDGAPVRLRLGSTVVRVQHDGAPESAQGVTVSYVRGGRTHRVQAAHCVLASYNMMIPYLMPELPDAQKQALHELVKTPLIYTSVALRHWRPFHDRGVKSIYAPCGFYSYSQLNPTTDIGAYHTPRSPEDPQLLLMMRAPCAPGLPEFDQNRAGRRWLLNTSFEDIERETRQQLTRMLAGTSFDAAHDIVGLTVNRWPHGYAPEMNSLFDPVVPENERPYVRGRARFGRVTIANSDSGGGAYTDVAIDQAHRAVHELFA